MARIWQDGGAKTMDSAFLSFFSWRLSRPKPETRNQLPCGQDGRPPARVRRDARDARCRGEAGRRRQIGQLAQCHVWRNIPPVSCPRGQKRPACPDSLRRQFRNQFATWRPTHPAAIAAVPDRTCRWATGRRSGPPLGRRSWTRIVGSSPAQSKNTQDIGWPRPVLRNPKLGEGSQPCRAARSEGGRAGSTM